MERTVKRGTYFSKCTDPLDSQATIFSSCQLQLDMLCVFVLSVTVKIELKDNDLFLLE